MMGYVIIYVVASKFHSLSRISLFPSVCVCVFVNDLSFNFPITKAIITWLQKKSGQIF